MDENNKIDEMLEYPDFDRLEKSNLRNLSKGTFVACAPKEPEEKTYTVTYYDGETVLKTEQVKERGKAPFLLCGISVRAIPPVHVVDILGNREYCKW